jgi:hypothetical protein
MCVLRDRLPAWGPFPFLRPSLLLRQLRDVVFPDLYLFLFPRQGEVLKSGGTRICFPTILTRCARCLLIVDVLLGTLGSYYLETQKYKRAGNTITRKAVSQPP